MENFYYEVINNVLQTPSDHATKATKLKQMKAKITRLHHEEQKRLFLNNAERDRLEDESPTVYHLIRKRERQTARTPQTIQDRNGVTHTTMEDIMHTFKEYMQMKFDTIPVDGDSLRGLMGSVTKKLPQDAANALDTPIILDELRCAVRKGKSNKAPGANGISHDLFKTMWETIKDDLLEIINHMYIDGKISDNQKHGLIICVPKKPRPTRPEDFRHLTLLSADLKLMAPILANRVSPWLTSIHHPSYHCGIYGHSIFEAIATVRETIAYTEYRRTSICILCIGYKEAFDNISHDYLFQLLELLSPP